MNSNKIIEESSETATRIKSDDSVYSEAAVVPIVKVTASSFSGLEGNYEGRKTKPSPEIIVTMPSEEGGPGSTSVRDRTTTTADNVASAAAQQPAEIVPETDADKDENDEEDDEDESEYEYDYEDEDGGFMGFLEPSEAAYISVVDHNNGTAVVPQDSEETYGHAPNKVEEDGIIRKTPGISIAGSSTSSSAQVEDITQFATVDSTGVKATKSKWKEPSQQAISMSLRAEKEKSGGKRRLASDLYRVMMSDTQEAGFHVEQGEGDSMDNWKVNLFNFDEDSELQKDLLVLGVDHVELEMKFPDQYPFEPPFVRVVRPRFKRQTGFVMNGALCMELLTKDGWNPINDIESVIVSIRSLLVVGEGRLQAAVSMPSKERELLLEAAKNGKKAPVEEFASLGAKRKGEETANDGKEKRSKSSGEYSMAEAKAAHSHLSKYHKQEGWSAHWARKG